MTTDAPQRLPRGRHGLSRGEVAAAQRERLLRALADAMAEKGYARTTVADVLRRARVSRETFYELFASKEDCFMGAFEEANKVMLAAVAAGAAEEERTPLERLDEFMRKYLETLAAEPARARIFMIEIYAAGPDATRRRIELQQRFADAVAVAFAVKTEEERFSIDAMIAAVTSLVTARLAVGDVDGLRALHGPLMRFIADQAFVRGRKG